ncbi:MAG TPA: hypothetical protein DDY68_06140 [Porphyromonadaceae bacterium]|nr:hypothetical protein [Porphyromonadaceae bacterium]
MLELFQYSFFRNALIGSVLLSIACGIVGTYIVVRRLTFISGGLTHASFGGLGLGYYLGWNPMLMAMLFAILSAWGVEYISKRKEVREDSVIAVFWSLGMALGIILLFLTPGYSSGLNEFLFGNILTITSLDLIIFGVLSLGIIIGFLLYGRLVSHIAFDPVFSLSQGLPVKCCGYVMITLIAITIVCCIRLVGIVLLISMLTVPQIVANLFTHSMKKMVTISILVGMTGCIMGLLISYWFNLPSGATIVFTLLIGYVVALCIKKYLVK